MISVFLASYNGEKYIRQQIESIASQKLDGEQLEIIVSDDCSKDKTLEILDDLKSQLTVPLTVTAHAEGSGSAQANFFRMFREWDGSSSYIMLSDQDDVWMDGKVRKMLEKMKEMESHYSEDCPILLHSDLQVADSSLKLIHPSLFHYQKISPERNKLNQLLVQNNVTGGAVMMNKSLALLLKQEPKVCLMHDAWMALTAAAFGQIGWVDEPLSIYRQHGNNTLGAEKADSLESAAERVKDGNKARDNYKKMFGQAQCLLDMFPDRLSPEQKELLHAFAQMENMGRAGKIKTILKYGFTKNTWLRTLGQMMFMGV